MKPLRDIEFITELAIWSQHRCEHIDVFDILNTLDVVSREAVVFAHFCEVLLTGWVVRISVGITAEGWPA